MNERNIWNLNHLFQELISKINSIKEESANASKLEFTFKNHLSDQELNTLTPAVSETIEKCQTKCKIVSTNLDKLVHAAQSGLKLCSEFDTTVSKADKELLELHEPEEVNKFENIEDLRKYLRFMEVRHLFLFFKFQNNHFANIIFGFQNLDFMGGFRKGGMGRKSAQKRAQK